MRTMAERVEFEEVIVTDPITNQKRDGVAVIRNGRQVASLPEADRLGRALNLRLEEVKDIVDNFTRIMNRDPTRDEREFWKAVLDFKRSQSRFSTEPAMGKLSDSERKAITERIRGLELKHRQAEISTGSRVICHNCGHAKPLAGAVRYGQYRLCNGCALCYELAKAARDVQTIEDFILPINTNKS